MQVLPRDCEGNSEALFVELPEDTPELNCCIAQVAKM